jgi:Tfp pilus assembly protein PilO
VFNSLTFRQKNIGLFIGTILLGLIAYQFSFSKTIDAYQKHNHQKATLTKAQSASSLIQKYQTELAKLEQQTNFTAYSEENLFRAISQFATENNLKVLAFPQAERIVNGEYEVITNYIEVSGNYKSIVELSYMIEHKRKLGRIASIEYKTEKNIQTRQTILKGMLYIQNIISNK